LARAAPWLVRGGRAWAGGFSALGWARVFGGSSNQPPSSQEEADGARDSTCFGTVCALGARLARVATAIGLSALLGARPT
jgi:hypothetical protein